MTCAVPGKGNLDLCLTLFLIFFARWAYLRVFIVSLKSASDGETHASMSVLLHTRMSGEIC